MATQLSYPALPHQKLGLWSIKQKINIYTGLMPNQIYTTGGYTYFGFAEDLTQEQIDTINAIVTDPNAQGPDVSLQLVNNTLILKDPYVYHAINEAAGLYYSIWYQASGDNGIELDEVVIIPTDQTHTMTKVLTNQDKRDFQAAIVDSFRWE